MPLTAYIIDDEAAARERLAYLLEEFLNDRVRIIGQAGSPENALGEIRKLAPDIIFLDVEMPGMSGLEIATMLNGMGYKGKIIFITAYDQYAIKAIRANAFDYIMKPVDVDELKEAILRAETVNGHQFKEEVVRHYGLSTREMELIAHLSGGLLSEEIAEAMFLSRHTVETHKRNIYQKTGTRNSIELLNLLSGKA